MGPVEIERLEPSEVLFHNENQKNFIRLLVPSIIVNRLQLKSPTTLRPKNTNPITVDTKIGAHSWRSRFLLLSNKRKILIYNLNVDIQFKFQRPDPTFPNIVSNIDHDMYSKQDR